MIIVEKIDGDFVTLEDGDSIIYKKLDELPAGISEGDVLEFDSVKNSYVVNFEKTSSRRTEILKLQESLWE